MDSPFIMDRIQDFLVAQGSQLRNICSLRTRTPFLLLMSLGDEVNT
jgi:hypothetical protein